MRDFQVLRLTIGIISAILMIISLAAFIVSMVLYFRPKDLTNFVSKFESIADSNSDVEENFKNFLKSNWFKQIIALLGIIVFAFITVLLFLISLATVTNFTSILILVALITTLIMVPKILIVAFVYNNPSNIASHVDSMIKKHARDHFYPATVVNLNSTADKSITAFFHSIQSVKKCCFEVKKEEWETFSVWKQHRDRNQIWPYTCCSLKRNRMSEQLNWTMIQGYLVDSDCPVNENGNYYKQPCSEIISKWLGSKELEPFLYVLITLVCFEALLVIIFCCLSRAKIKETAEVEDNIFDGYMDFK